MSPYVRLEGVLVEKCFRTVFTLELLHSEMSFYVELVLGTGGEFSRAQVTFEGLLSCVYSYVLLKVAILIERLLTVGTFERLCSIVPSYVRHKTGSVLKLLSALVTEKLGLLHMNSFMRGQVALGFKSLITFITSKSALAGVSLQVPCEEVSNFESLSTSLVGTGVHLSIVHRKSVTRVGSVQNKERENNKRILCFRWVAVRHFFPQKKF